MRRIATILSSLAVLVALAAGACALLPGPLYAGEVVGLETAFAMLASYAPMAAITAGVLGLLAGVLAIWHRRWVTSVISLVAFLAGAAVILSLLDLQQTAAANPLHDITTDLDNPPQFEAMPARNYEPESDAARAAHPHPDWRAAHMDLYSDIEPVTLTLPLDQAVERVTLIAEEMGWAVEAVVVEDTTARLEAVATTGWFGFSDDIVVRLTPAASGVTVDARSVSRVGIGDLGANATRLRAFFDGIMGT